MGFQPFGFVAILVVYLLVASVVAVLAYLVIRFAIRDGLRAHTLWLRRTGSPPPPSEWGE